MTKLPVSLCLYDSIVSEKLASFPSTSMEFLDCFSLMSFVFFSARVMSLPHLWVRSCRSEEVRNGDNDLGTRYGCGEWMVSDELERALGDVIGMKCPF